MQYDFYNSPLGKMVLCSDGKNLTALAFVTNVSSADCCVDFKTNSRANCIDSKISCTNAISHNLPIFTQTKEWLDLYFSGEIPHFMPNIAFPSNASRFALRVWEILLGIPYGEILTYGAIAKCVAREFSIAKMSAQAVGGTVGRNPIAIIVPCHRVLGANLNITGYAGGVDKKLALLQIEGNDIKRFKMPK